MYAKLVDSKLIEFKGKILNYTVTTDDGVYKVSSINPTEEEMNTAGYWRVVADSSCLEDENTKYMLSGNIIVPAEAIPGENTDEKADIQ